MTDAPEPKTKPGTGWVRIVLFASLAVNLLIAGVFAGAVLRHERGDRSESERAPLRELGYGPYGQALSRSDRREISKAMIGRAGDIKENRAAVREQFETLLQALRTVPFSPAVVREVISGQQDILFERQKIGQLLLLERIEAMDDAERAAFAERLERSLRRGAVKGRPKP